MTRFKPQIAKLKLGLLGQIKTRFTGDSLDSDLGDCWVGEYHHGPPLLCAS